LKLAKIKVSNGELENSEPLKPRHVRTNSKKLMKQV